MEPNEVYSVAHFDHGIAIRGEMPLLMESILSNIYHNQFGYDIVDLDIAEKLNALIIFTTASKAKKWREILGISTENLKESTPTDIPELNN